MKDAAGVRNVGEIIAKYPHARLGVVVSAMGKTTNQLETLLNKWYHRGEWQPEFEAVTAYHHKIVSELFPVNHPVFARLDAEWAALQARLTQTPGGDYDFHYDQVVSLGEVVSTLIVSAWLQQVGVENTWLDARTIIRTNAIYRDANIDWEFTANRLNDLIQPDKRLSGAGRIHVIQGFIGHTAEGHTTTLGREGSDFSAAILAYCLNADSVIIWKDVPGMLNADPKYFKDTVKLKQISFREAIELAYYGASVIHPKTIKPLQNKEIPLYVKSFLHPDEEGTLIHSSTFTDSLVPSYIFKQNQILISASPRDFSFINEENLSAIFSIFAQQRIRINLMQNSAINFSVCVDDVPGKVNTLIEQLGNRFEVRFNRQCELVTIRHYDQHTLSRLLVGRTILLEQRSRNTARLVLAAEQS